VAMDCMTGFRFLARTISYSLCYHGKAGWRVHSVSYPIFAAGEAAVSHLVSPTADVKNAYTLHRVSYNILEALLRENVVSSWVLFPTVSELWLGGFCY
jgi:hypothetical protein